ncbi:MAG: orotidine-5'-phosphate decarboxylase [Ignavibacteria bacterium CG_4_10_14_3_um_filter_37_18]|nr:MAG: orotidine-5'-phosphate decarboxylase [Ignavibacteria bacterium CG_4_10_14_3_um_filter_37_18]
MKSIDKFYSAVNNGKHICVGLDTDIKMIPDHLKLTDDPIFLFNKAIIDATRAKAAAYKLNFAFYEAAGIEGLKSLKRTIEYIGEEIFIIGDAKRGDIGSTSAMYAKSLFDYFNCDSVTLHPYMGYDSIQPFLQYKDKLNFILTLTSNKSARDFESLTLSTNEKLYQKVLEKVNEWNRQFANCGIVFGATQIAQLQENMQLIKDLPVLLPGIGAQGGSLEEVVTLVHQNHFTSYLINAGRSIIYASNGSNFAEKAAEELEKLNAKIALLSSTKSFNAEEAL